MTIGRIPSVEGGIQPTIVDAKGDLIAGVAADSINRLAVGSNDQVLVADSSTSTGLAWKSYGAQFVAGKNKIINGDFYWNQRNFTSNTSNGTYNFDRWFQRNSDGTVTVTPQTFTPGSAPVSGYESPNFVQFVTSGQTLASAYAILCQRIEDVRTLAGQTITVSFWAKATSGTPKIALEVVQNFNSGSGGSANVDTPITAITLSTSWARYSATITVPSISGKTIAFGNYIELNLWMSAGSNFATRASSIGIQSNTFQFWGVQVEAGNVATPFTTATGTLQGERSACERYYWRYTGSSAYATYGTGSAISSTQAEIVVNFPTTMRTNPTSAEGATLALGDGVNAVSAVTTIVVPQSNLGKAIVRVDATGLTQYRPYVLINNNSLSGYLGFSAEL